MITTIRIPDVLQARIDLAAGKDGRTKWILEACRMRLDNATETEPSRAEIEAKIKLTQQLEASLAVTPETETVRVMTKSGYVDAEFTSQQPVQPSIQELRDICAGKGVTLVTEATPFYVAAEMAARSLQCTYKEYDEQSGETMACGLAQHSMKQKHGNWRKA